MERDRKTKMLSIVALMIAIAGLSLGFAAFSTTLSISSSASVTPNSSDFSVGFYSDTTATLATTGPDEKEVISASSTGNAFATDVYIDAGITSISGLEANFTAPGETVTYSFYVGNSGKYDAYLRAINFLTVSGSSSSKVCTAGDGATASLVEAACDAITMTVDVNGTTATSTNDIISGNELLQGTYAPVTITLTYASNGARADGDFSVEFGGISLDYSTVDGSNLIAFTIDGIEFQAENGMTWQEWYDSDYNTSPVYIEFEHLCSNYLTNSNLGNLTDVIQAGVAYPEDSAGHCK